MGIFLGQSGCVGRWRRGRGVEGGGGNYAVCCGRGGMGWLRWDGCVVGFWIGTGERGAEGSGKPLLECY